MNLYVSTISRLLVMSVISSRTPNNLRSPKHRTHNTNCHRMLSLRTLRVRELCRHDWDTIGFRVPADPWGSNTGVRMEIFPLGVPVTPPINTQYTPEHFRCSNTIIVYINIYLSTILRLLVMSVISSGIPNNLRSPKHITHNKNRHRTLSLRTLRVRELCRHGRDTSPVNNQ